MLHVYGDNLTEADWFINLSPLLSGATFVRIGPRGSNPPAIEELVKYDRPDIVLTVDEQPVLVVERTREVPSGHNVGQRMARAVRAAELGVPFIKFLPFDAKKHGAHAGICHLNARVLEAFERMSILHNTPVVAVNWECDANGELVCNGREDDLIRQVVHEHVQLGFSKHTPLLDAQARANVVERARRIVAYPRYAGMPGSVCKFSTASWLSSRAGVLSALEMNHLQATLGLRNETWVYTIGMRPASCKRQDPYTGAQFLYDYIACRNGPLPEDKVANLVLHFPHLDRRTWYARNPNNPLTKSSNWYLTANALSFADGVDLLRS